MTREEAITILKDISWQMGSVKRWENIEAIDMAIEALQREDRFLKSMDTNEPLYTEVVRCKDCRYYNPIDENKPYPCGYGMYMCNSNDFCSYGERREP